MSEVYRQHKGRYGQRRIAAVLSWNKKKAGRIMGLLGLKAKVRSKRTCRPQAIGEAAANILNREFSAVKSRDKWLTDVTEFKCTDGKLYLSPILDVFNREIVAHSLSRRANGDMVTQMLDNAFGRLKGATPLPHSDQGVLYRTGAYRAKLAENGIVQSMSRKGNCRDNAPMESFFGTLKTESFYEEGGLSVAELTTVINDYIHYYNHERISLNLKKLSPVAYRTQLEEAV
ncbi:IS3 family transposase [Neisseria dumasiana]|uniref:IS3 family transposase n=1 Tax=Neisseria dumasiana TaxID=1931275 RepID=UPI000A191806|nr:IS3 family transposase [Neisseria dumasiana]UOO83912.1 IS3 family transposase [Neisseria dumasiana]